MSMNILPAFVLSVLSTVSNLSLLTLQIANGAGTAEATLAILQMLGSMYLTLFVIGAITTTQWKKLHTTAWKKVLYAFTFPVFMFTYLPISIAALFAKVEWKPITHSVTAKQVNLIQ